MLKFIGFADSDKFLEAIDRSRPVNLTIGRKHGKPDRRFGVSVDSSILTMSQVQGDEALYFEHITYRWQVIGGHSMGSDAEKAGRLAEQALDAAKRYLMDHSINFREALLSMPASYIHMDGEATFLHWDEGTKSYSYAAPAEHQ